MSNFTGGDAGSSFSSGNTGELEAQNRNQLSKTKDNLHGGNTSLPPAKKKRNLPGTPDPTAEVIALSPKTLMATNRFVCEICSKGFQRDQNLQLHRRGHNLPWKLKQRTTTDTRKRVYICPEPSCVHNHPSRALGDLTGIKKHYSRKHGEKKWKCDRCSKKYAVQSDWKAHQKTCGTREYKCDCGTIFSRRDSFITHRAFCDALAEENNKVNLGMLQSQQMTDHYTPSLAMNTGDSMSMELPEFGNYNLKSPLKLQPQEISMPYEAMNVSRGLFSSSSGTLLSNPRGVPSSTSGLDLSSSNGQLGFGNLPQETRAGGPFSVSMAHMSATALLQKAAQIGATASNVINSSMMQKSYVTSMAGPDQTNSDGPSPTPSYFDVQGSFHNILTQPEGYNALQKPNPQDTYGPGPKPILGSDPVMNDTGTYSEMLKRGDQCLGLMNMGHEDGKDNNSDLIQSRDDSGIVRGVPGNKVGGNETMTVDFLGIGGSRSLLMQEQRRFGSFEAAGLQHMQAMNPFQQLINHDSSTHEKPIWEE
uniref:zinc finger protein GAI-ASSOCIATED FACTOR 1-like n=1 Tax=Erigeron canadensis TaxID=72917 RepID=UPI001CB8A65C|nr:zinc finger protein GAI-ASSOCIATED FACTOR 1-like [Erigeron canadensis]